METHNRLALIIDDSATVRHIISTMLSKEGYQVIQAENGKDGIDKLKAADALSIVICDINMPEYDGFYFLNVKSILVHPNTLTPVIMLTTETSDELKAKALNAGAKAYINKPVNLDSLRNVIQEVYDGDKEGSV